MARRATPRPTYDAPGVIRSADCVRHLWGDPTSGYVGDEVLLSSSLLHVLIFTLPVGGRFAHSQDNRTVFAADEAYVVLEGTIAVVEPTTGEIARAEVGDAVFFRRDTWHHGINWGTGPVRVLEMFSPPPAAGASSQYAKEQPYLDVSYDAEDHVLGRWPMERAEIAAASRLTRVRPDEQRFRAEGDLQTGLICSTEHLTVVDATLLPGCSSDLRRHGGDALFHLTAGEVHVHAPSNDGPIWWRVQAGESFVLPEGTEYRLVNQGREVVRLVLGVAPSYLASPDAR
jgi:quercetin dioxygenase-like cupin family protein